MSATGKPVVIRMDAELHDQIKARAQAEERSMAQTIRWALKCYVTSPLRDPEGTETPQ